MPECRVYAVKLAGSFVDSGALPMWMKEWDRQCLGTTILGG